MERSLFVKFYHLFLINLRNARLWLGVCVRDYTYIQRISILMVRLLTSIAIAALFFGRSKDTVIGDISLTFFESVLGFVPMFLIQRFITKYKPNMTRTNSTEIEMSNVIDRQLVIPTQNVKSIAGSSDGKTAASPDDNDFEIGFDLAESPRNKNDDDADDAGDAGDVNGTVITYKTISKLLDATNRGAIGEAGDEVDAADEKNGETHSDDTGAATVSCFLIFGQKR